MEIEIDRFSGAREATIKKYSMMQVRYPRVAGVSDIWHACLPVASKSLCALSMSKEQHQAHTVVQCMPHTTGTYWQATRPGQLGSRPAVHPLHR